MDLVNRFPLLDGLFWCVVLLASLVTFVVCVSGLLL